MKINGFIGCGAAAGAILIGAVHSWFGLASWCGFSAPRTSLLTPRGLRERENDGYSQLAVGRAALF